MLKQSITYTDFNGIERTEDFYFNLTKVEVMEISSKYSEGLVEAMNAIVASKDNYKIVEIFKTIILQAYGEKSEDGKRFIKNQVIRDNFAATEAYSELFISMLDSDKAAAFINGITPKSKQLPIDKG